MQKILSLGAKEFLTGIAPGSHYSNKGVWASASGLNLFRRTAADKLLLQTTSAATQITGIDQEPMTGLAVPTSSTAGKLYVLGDDGGFFSKNLQDDSAFTNLRSGTPITTPANGMFLFKPAGGSEKLYYMQVTQIGEWDMSGT
jgi:hypothetical protein